MFIVIVSPDVFARIVTKAAGAANQNIRVPGRRDCHNLSRPVK